MFLGNFYKNNIVNVDPEFEYSFLAAGPELEVCCWVSAKPWIVTFEGAMQSHNLLYVDPCCVGLCSCAKAFCTNLYVAATEKPEIGSSSQIHESCSTNTTQAPCKISSNSFRSSCSQTKSSLLHCQFHDTCLIVVPYQLPRLFCLLKLGIISQSSHWKENPLSIGVPNNKFVSHCQFSF